MTRIDSGESESVDFTTPRDSLTIIFANGTNNLQVLGLADDYNTPTNEILGGSDRDTIRFETTGQAGANWNVVLGDGNDLVEVDAAQNILGPLKVFAGPGTDFMTVTLPTGVIGAPILFDGEEHDPGGRDEIQIITNADNTLAQIRYTGGTDRTQLVFDVGGNAITMERTETLTYRDTTGTGRVMVVGSNADDLLTVAPVTSHPDQPVLVFNNTPSDASGPFNGPPEEFFRRLPGVAGGSRRPDLYLAGLSPLDSLTISDPMGNNRLYVYGQSEMPLHAGTTFDPFFDPFGFGWGNLLPGLPSGNAFDQFFVTDTSTTVNGFEIAYNNTDFVQPSSDLPAIVINSGFEGNPAATPGVDVADDIAVIPSANYRFRINGGDPDPASTEIVPPDGDRLKYLPPTGEVSIWANKASPAAVAFGAPGMLPVEISSIEHSFVSLPGGTVNLVGDNNNVVAQPDHFVVMGRDVDGFAGDGGHQEMVVQINGGIPILIDRLSNLNVLGHQGSDTLEIRPYADNTPQGWGVNVFFDEGPPQGADGDVVDLLIYQTSLFGGAVSENIVIQPSGPENGEVRVTNAANGTPITTISYVANLDIVVTDDDGSLSDTDALTLRGTASSTPQASGREFFDIDLTRAGTDADPMITVGDRNPLHSLPPTLYRVRSVTGISHIDVQTLDGDDVVQVRPVPNAWFFVDAGPPSGSAPGRADVLNVITGGDPLAFGVGPQSDEGTFYVGVNRPLSFDNVEQLFVDTAPYVRPDSHEVNDTIASASVLGSLPAVTVTGGTLHGTNGSTGPEGGTTTTDVDVYRYTANRTGYLIVNLLFSHDAGDLQLDILDGAGNGLAAANTATDNEQLIIPVVSQQNYFVRVSSVDSRPTTYDLEIEDFAAPLPTAIDVEDNFDTGRSNTDNVTRLAPVDLLIHADLSDFDAFGIPVLTAAQAAAGNTAGVAVEVFRNGVSLGFANPEGGLPDLFRFTVSAAQLLGGIATGSPVGPVAANAFGYQNLFTAAVRVFDNRPTPATGRTTATARLAVTYDPNPPDPALASIELLSASDSSIVGDLVTNIRQPAFWGIGEANTRVRIYASRSGGALELVGEGVVGSDRSDEAVAGRTIGGKVVGGLANDGLGLWEITVEPLTDGTYSFVAVFEDLAGNVTATSGPDVSVVSGVVVDTLPPQRPTIDLLDAHDTGRSDLDNVTIGNPTTAAGQATFRISAEPGSQVFVKDGEVVIASFTFNAAFDLLDGVADGFGLLTIDFVANQGIFNIPAEGPHPLSVESFDLAGNRSAQSEELLVTIDFTPPAAPTAPDLVADSDTGLFDNDNVTKHSRTSGLWFG